MREQHEIAVLEDGVPAYRLVNADSEGRYRLTKRIVTDPEADALAMQVAFEALRGQAEDYALYLFLNLYIKNQGGHNALAAGQVEEARALCATLACFANAGGMLPEQVWDTADIPERGLFLGHGADAATPLAWAHMVWSWCPGRGWTRQSSSPPGERCYGLMSLTKVWR